MNRSGLDGRERAPVPGGAGASPRGDRTSTARRLGQVLGWLLVLWIVVLVGLALVAVAFVAGGLMARAVEWAVGA